MGSSWRKDYSCVDSKAETIRQSFKVCLRCTFDFHSFRETAGTENGSIML